LCDWVTAQVNPNFQVPGQGMPPAMAGRVRPQSAKTQDDQQLKFQQQFYQPPQAWGFQQQLPPENYSY